jgi:hypothetical protein
MWAAKLQRQLEEALGDGALLRAEVARLDAQNKRLRALVEEARDHLLPLSNIFMDWHDRARAELAGASEPTP